MSFFDEADEPRTAPRRRRPTGTGRRPPTDQQSVQARRAVAGVAILIVVILIVLGVHSCQVSARDSALKDYNNGVASLIQESNQTGGQFFNQLSGAAGATNGQDLTNQINQTRVTADAELKRAEQLNVPDEAKGAQQNLVLTMTMRRDGIANIAPLIQQALGTSTSKDAVNLIAAEMARFYASDAVYKDYTGPLIAAALHSAGIALGGANGQAIEPGQFLTDLGWLTPTFIAAKLGASAPSTSGKPAPGVHGHSLNTVSVAGTTLQTGTANTISASPPPTFMVSFTNAGTVTETNVVVKVSIASTSVTAQTVVPQTTAGQQLSASVPLTSAPPKGTYTVNVTVEGVPGEKNLANNTLSFPVTFQ